MNQSGRVGPERPEIEMFARVVDVGVDLLLLPPPLARQAGVADEQEEEDPDDGDEVDRQEPCHRGRGATVARHDDDRRDADRDVGDEDEDQPPRRIERDSDQLASPGHSCPAYWDFRSALGCGRCRRKASLGALLGLDAGVHASLGAVGAKDAAQDEEEQGAHDDGRQQ